MKLKFNVHDKFAFKYVMFKCRWTERGVEEGGEEGGEEGEGGGGRGVE